MNTSEMDPIEPGTNPYLSDAFNMGMTLGTNVVVMFGNHQNEECKYLIVVNTETGERLRITFEVPEPARCHICGQIGGH